MTGDGFSGMIPQLTRRLLVALYSTFSPIQALEPDSRQQFLDKLAQIANDQFAGHVERPLVTVLYTARRG